MAWEPGLHSVSRPLIVRNLLAWISDSARQAEALAWAKAQLQFAGDVPNFKGVYGSSKGLVGKPEFPSLMLVRRSTQFQEPADDYSIELTHRLAFLPLVADADPEVLTEKVEVYCAALVSMLWACPPDVLMEDVPTQGHPTINVESSDGDETRGDSNFTQMPRVTVKIDMLEVRSG